MNKFFLPTLAIVAFAAPASQAQNFSKFERSFDVSGSLQTPEGRRDINSIAVKLGDDGKATLRLTGRGNGWWQNNQSDTNFSGRWYGTGHEVTIDLNKVSGRNVFGTATLRFDSDVENNIDNRRGGWGNGRDDDRVNRRRPRLEQVTIAGRSGNGGWETKTFTGTFAIDDRQGGDNGGNDGPSGGIRDLFTSKKGYGKVRINSSDDGNDEIRSAKVELNREGEAKITLEGRRTWLFEGSWRQTARERIAISLDSSASTESTRRVPNFSKDGELGNGEIVLDGLSLDSIRLSGRRGDDNFNVNFSVKQNGDGNSHGDNSDAVFLERKFGSGQYKGERENHKLNGITIRLRENRGMFIDFGGDGRDFSLRGKWTKVSGREYTANVSGDGFSGLASVLVDRGKITGFSFNGRDRAGRCFITPDLS